MRPSVHVKHRGKACVQRKLDSAFGFTLILDAKTASLRHGWQHSIMLATLTILSLAMFGSIPSNTNS